MWEMGVGAGVTEMEWEEPWLIIHEPQSNPSSAFRSWVALSASSPSQSLTFLLQNER